MSRLSDAVAAMLASLKVHVPPGGGVSLVSLQEKTVGLGDRRGEDTRGGLAVVALKGVRIAAAVRFQLWNADVDGLENAMLLLQEDLVESQKLLAAEGFLSFELRDTTLVEFIDARWRQTLVADALYEYNYEDSDDALGLIGEIPILLQEQFDDRQVVRGDLARWDEVAARDLATTGPTAISGLATFANLPLAPSGSVTIRRTYEGAPPATPYDSFDDFLSAVTGSGSVERNGSFTFPTVDALSAALSPDGALELDSKIFEVRSREWAPTLRLPRGEDRLEIVFSEPKFSETGVLYLRVMRGARKI